jgi:hypothetical protein
MKFFTNLFVVDTHLLRTTFTCNIVHSHFVGIIKDVDNYVTPKKIEIVIFLRVSTDKIYLLQLSFHLGPEAGSNTKTPPSHSTQEDTPLLLRL